MFPELVAELRAINLKQHYNAPVSFYELERGHSIALMLGLSGIAKELQRAMQKKRTALVLTPENSIHLNAEMKAAMRERGNFLDRFILITRSTSIPDLLEQEEWQLVQGYDDSTPDAVWRTAIQNGLYQNELQDFAVIDRETL